MTFFECRYSRPFATCSVYCHELPQHSRDHISPNCTHSCAARFTEPSRFRQLLEEFALACILEHEAEVFAVGEIVIQANDIGMSARELMTKGCPYLRFIMISISRRTWRSTTAFVSIAWRSRHLRARMKLLSRFTRAR